VRAVGVAQRLVHEIGLAADLGVTDRLAQLQADLHDYRALYTQVCDRVADQGVEPGPEASLLKVYVTELLQRIVQFSVDSAAEYGGQAGDLRLGGWAFDLHWPYMMARPGTIYAGCNEVQRDILAKTVLQLGSAR
jgi:alkylation response protein AidB-like acyl-CoA dehydrogenase